MRNKNTNVTWLDLLMVVAIMLTTALITIPRLVRSKTAADEASAIGSLRTAKSAPAKPSIKVRSFNLSGTAMGDDTRYGQRIVGTFGESNLSDAIMDIPMNSGSIAVPHTQKFEMITANTRA